MVGAAIFVVDALYPRAPPLHPATALRVLLIKEKF